MKKKLIWGICIIVIIIGIILIIRSRKKGPVYQLVEAELGNVSQIVSVTGTITSAREVDLQFENTGKIKEIAVSVGDRVSAGQVLVRLNTAELNAQFQSNKAALEVAEAQLAQTLIGNRPEDVQVYETAVVNAEVDLKNKQQALIDAQDDADNDLNQDYEDVQDILQDAYNKSSDAVYKQIDDLFTNDEINPNLTFDSAFEGESERKRAVASTELSNFQSELDSLDSSLETAKQHLLLIRELLSTLMDALNDSTGLTSVNLTAYKANVTTARTNVNTALTNITTQEQVIASTKITNQVNINTAEAAVDTAEAALKTAQDQLIFKKAAPLQADVDLAKAKVRQAQANVLQIQEKINKTILKAPIDGFITLIDKEIGEIAQTGTAIISIIAADHFQIEANISETEISKVNLNDKVKMTLDALGPDEEFTGKIIKIDPAETIVSGVIYYKITSAFDVKDERIKSGMTANLEIQTDKKDNVIYLPYYSVHEVNGRKYVKILSDQGDVVEKDVRTGLEGEVNLEIVNGIEQGQQVIIFSEE